MDSWVSGIDNVRANMDGETEYEEKKKGSTVANANTKDQADARLLKRGL